MLNSEKIMCAENEGDFLVFRWEPGSTDGRPAGIEMVRSSDGSVTMDMPGLIALRDACNRAIHDNEETTQ